MRNLMLAKYAKSVKNVFTRVRPLYIIAALFLMICGYSTAEEPEIFSVAAFPELTFSSENVITLPPGDITGSALKTDEISTYANMRIALYDPETGDLIAETVSDENGEFAFEEVPEGQYVLVVGNPGLVTIVNVVAGASVGQLDVIVPAPAALPVPAWAPAFVQAAPALTAAGVATGAIVTGAAVHRYNTRRTDRQRAISPIMP